MKKIEWENPNKMKINTGHRRFDDQTSLLSPHQVLSDTQVLMCIRGWKDCGEGLHIPVKAKPGELTMFDLQIFKLSDYIKNIIIKYCKENSKNGIKLSVFRHFNEDKEMIHGYVITDMQSNHLRTITTGPTSKSLMVLNECKKYICTENSLT